MAVIFCVMTTDTVEGDWEWAVCRCPLRGSMVGGLVGASVGVCGCGGGAALLKHGFVGPVGVGSTGALRICGGF